MAGSDSSQDDRTESPTAYRREEFRKQGSVAQSRELVSVAVLLCICLCLPFLLSHLFSGMQTIFQTSWQWNGKNAATLLNPKNDWTAELFWTQARVWAWTAFLAIGPILAIVMVAGTAACVAQVGFFLTLQPLAPNLDRLNVAQGLQRIFSFSNSFEVVKAMGKIALVALIFWLSFSGRGETLGMLFEKPVSELSPLLREWIGGFILRVLFALGVVAGLDYFWQRWKLEKRMKMTKREVREEYRLREGDPMLKARVRGVQRKMARKRMMDAVKKADVIVTNPTHLSVALQYELGKMVAPKVVAKGAGFLALKIRLVAKAHGVPLVENKPLARALFKDIEIGQAIPQELYKAVAQVLGYVYRLKRAAKM